MEMEMDMAEWIHADEDRALGIEMFSLPLDPPASDQPLAGPVPSTSMSASVLAHLRPTPGSSDSPKRGAKPKPAAGTPRGPVRRSLPYDHLILAGRLQASPKRTEDIAQEILESTGIVVTAGALRNRWATLRSRITEWPSDVPVPSRQIWSQKEMDDASALVRESMGDSEHPSWQVVGDLLKERGFTRSLGSIKTKWFQELRHSSRNTGSSSADLIQPNDEKLGTDAYSEDDEDEDDALLAHSVGTKRTRGELVEHVGDDLESPPMDDKGKRRRFTSTPPADRPPNAPPSSEPPVQAHTTARSYNDSSSFVPGYTDVTLAQPSLVDFLNKSPPQGFGAKSLMGVLNAFKSMSEEHKGHFSNRARDVLASVGGSEQPEGSPSPLRRAQVGIEELQGEARRAKSEMVRAIMDGLRKWEDED